MNFDQTCRRMLGVAVVIGVLVAQPALAAAGGARARARSAEGSSQPAATTAKGLAAFGEFLDQHPEIEARLREHPGLINNPAFQKNHQAVPQFLALHPDIRPNLAQQPRWFVHRELGRQSEAPMSREQLADFDRLLDQHPGLEKALVQQPRLLRQSDFIGKHAELRDYLKRHPGSDRANEPKRDRRKKADRKN
jgi:hypothetical protein